MCNYTNVHIVVCCFTRCLLEIPPPPLGISPHLKRLLSRMFLKSAFIFFNSLLINIRSKELCVLTQEWTCLT